VVSFLWAFPAKPCTNNSVNRCLFLACGILLVSYFCHLVIISSKYILNSVGERVQPWCTPLLSSESFDNLELSFIDILFFVFMSIIVFNNVSGIFLDFRTSKSVF
jgi:hypothetical protein